MRKDWPQVQIHDVQVDNEDRQNIPVGESVKLQARVQLGGVDPQHVRVEAYHGEAENGGIKNPNVTVLEQAGPNGDGSYIYQGRFLPPKAVPTASVCGWCRHIQIWCRGTSSA